MSRELPEIERPPRRLIVARCDRLGDVIIASTCLPLLKRQFPGMRLYLLARPEWLSLFSQSPHLEGCIPYREDAEYLAQEIVQREADAIAHLHPDAVAEEAAAVARIPIRIGLAQYARGRHLTHALPWKKKTATRHEALQTLDILKPLGLQVPDSPEQLTPAPAPALDTARQRMATLLPAKAQGRPYATFAPFAYGNKPVIPPLFFARLADFLIEHHGMEILIVGNEAQHRSRPKLRRVLASEIPLFRQAHVHDLIGKTSLPETAALLAGSSLHFSRDTGPAHLAAALGAPTLTLFLEPDRYNRSLRWKPLGKRVSVLESPAERRWWESRQAFARSCIRAFTPEEVIAAAAELLA